MKTCFICVYKLSEADGYAELVAVDHRAKTVFPLRLPVKDCVMIRSVSLKKSRAEDSLLSCGGDVENSGDAGDMVPGVLKESRFISKTENEFCVRGIPGHSLSDLVHGKFALQGSPKKQLVDGFFQFFVLLRVFLFKGCKFFFRRAEFAPKSKMLERMGGQDLFVAKTAGSFDGYAQLIAEDSSKVPDVLAEDDAQGGKDSDGSPLDDAVDDGAPIAGCEKINHALHGGSVTGLN